MADDEPAKSHTTIALQISLADTRRPTDGRHKAETLDDLRALTSGPILPGGASAISPVVGPRPSLHNQEGVNPQTHTRPTMFSLFPIPLLFTVITEFLNLTVCQGVLNRSFSQDRSISLSMLQVLHSQVSTSCA